MKTPWMSPSRASRWSGGVVLALALVSITGCSAIAVALGLRRPRRHHRDVGRSRSETFGCK